VFGNPGGTLSLVFEILITPQYPSVQYSRQLLIFKQLFMEYRPPAY